MKRSGKRLLAVLLCLAMAMTLLPVAALARWDDDAIPVIPAEQDGKSAVKAELPMDAAGDDVSAELSAATITPDGAVADTWVQDANTDKGGAICEISSGKLHLKTNSSHGNNAGLNLGTPPAVFLNTTMNAVLAASTAEEKTLSFDIEAVAASTGNNPLFGILLNYKSGVNETNTANKDVLGYYIGYDSYSKWYYQSYVDATDRWGGTSSVSGADFDTANPVHIEVTWTDTAVKSFKLNNEECLSGDKDMSIVTNGLGVIDSVGFKVGYYSSDNVGDFYISNLHYTGQATVSVYNVSGKVTDSESGDALAGVAVKAGSYTATTDAQGNYTLENLAAGTYTLTFSKEGYGTETETVEVSNADVTRNVTMTASDAVEIQTDGVNNGDWRQVENTKQDSAVDPKVEDGRLVLTSGYTNGHKIKDTTNQTAIFISDKMTEELAAFAGDTKTVSFTLIPETKHSSNSDSLMDYLAFGIVVDSDEGNTGLFMGYSDPHTDGRDFNDGWLYQSYGGSGSYHLDTDRPAPTPGKPIKFEITWTRSELTLKINGEVADTRSMGGLTQTDKVAFCVGGNFYQNENGSLQDNRQTVIRISDLHYSGQETVSARYVKGAVTCGDTPVVGATVSVAGDLTGAYTQTTDEAGKYSVALPLKAESYTLSATKDGYDTANKTVAVTATADKSTLEAVDFALTQLPVISGTVKNSKGSPILGATVSSDKRPEGASTTTNAEGVFEVVGAVDGDHTLTISAEGYETKTIKVTVSGADVSIPEDITLEDRQIPSYTLSTDDMDVKVAQAFPQAIQYTLKDGKTMYGQTAELDTIKINNVAVKPAVTSKLSSDNKKVTYTMVIDSTNNNGTGVTATITAEIRVGLDDINNKDSAAAGRTLGFYITDVTYPNNDRLAHPVDTIEIPNHSLVSVRSAEEGAAVTGAKLADNTVTSGDTTYAAADFVGGTMGSIDYFAAFVYNNELSAGLASNSAYGTSSAGSDTYPVRAQFEAKDGGATVSIGLGSTLWYYDHNITVNQHPDDKTLTDDQLSLEQRVIAPLDMPYAKVVITGDMNDSDTVDWQDGAIAYRETVMHIPTGGESVADAVNLRISMNFGSMATNPFLIALDNVKRVSAHTDGLGQFVLLKGYAGEGHDSNHPQYDNIGIRMGGPEDLLTLMTEGEKLGATFGIHTNASEFYAEAITEESQIRRNTNGSLHYGWNWLDQGIAINGLYDYATGLRKARWDKLYEIVKGHPFTVYVDVWGNHTSGREDDFQTRALSNEIISHDDWRIAHEWAWANPYESTFQHWTTDFTYGTYRDKGKLNSNVLRFILNQYKDSFTADFASYGGAANAPLLGGPAMQGFEGWQGDGEYDLSIYNTFNQMVYTKFLQHYPVVEWTNADKTVTIPYNGSDTAGASRNNSTVANWLPETQIKLSDGKDKIVVTRGTSGELVTDFGLDTVDKFLEGEAEYRSRVVTLNGKVIVIGAPASAGEDNTFPADVATLKYLIPWYWTVDGERVKADDEKLYHWNAKGGQSTWELPNGWENLANVMVYELSDQGRGTGKRVNVADGSVTLSDIKANTCYVVTKGTDKGVGPKITYGTGLHVEDPSFNIDTPKGPWKIEGKGSAVHTTNSEGIGMMMMVGEVSVSQQMTDLKAGTNYVSYVAVDNRSNAKASMTITDNTGKVVATNYTTRSIAKNYISSYYLHNGHGVEAGGSYFQNMFVYFTPEAGKTYTMTLSREAGMGNVYFDDLRTVEYGFNYSGFGAGQTAQKSKGSAKSPVTYVKDANGNNTSVISKLEQDFENVPQGIWPFVIGPVENVADNRSHVSELNAPFTQAGWDVKKLDDVIEGNWSIKINGLSGRNNLVYQTIPQNFRFEPNNVYTVSFDYELGSTNSYVAVVGDGAYTGLGSLTVYNLDKTLQTTVPTTPNVSTGVNKADVGHMEFTVVGSESGQTWIGIYSKENANNQGTSGAAAAFGGYTDFVLDNLSIKLAPPEKNELALLLQQADAMEDSSIYTAVEGTDEDAWSALEDARDNGHDVFDDDHATTAQVTSAVTALKAAIENLVKVNVSISGTVTNANSKPVAGVVLTLENATYFPTGLTVTTGEDGTFEFVSKSGVELVPATYHIKAEATGYYVTTTDDIAVDKTDAEKTQDISLEAENPGAYVNDFNNGDISMMGPVVTTPADELPTMEWVEYNGSGALKVTWNGRTGETRETNNVVDKTTAFANGTFSFDVTALTTGARFCVTMRTTDGNNRLTIGQEDTANKWFGEFWGVSEGSTAVNNGYTATTNNSGKAYVEPGATRNVRVTLDGTQATVYIDGMQVYSVNLIASNLIGSSVDAITTAGWCGINMRNNAGTEFIIDNIRIIRNDTAVGVYNVSGAVTTGSGSDPVSGAAVDLYDGENRISGTATNALGQYQLTGVAPGDYTLKVTAPFFQEEDATVTVTNADVDGKNFDLDPDLTSLTALIAEVEDLNEEDYTAETWTVLANALTAAEAIDSSSSIAAVNTAYRDLSNAKEALEPSGISADFSQLRALYNEKAVLENAGYTADSWNALQDALSAASAVLGNGKATQAQIDTAKDDIQTAFDALEAVEVEGVDIAGLQSAYNAAKDEVSDDYTEESWSAFEQARENVLVLLNSAADLTADDAEEIAAAIKALTDAQTALVKKPTANDTPTTRPSTSTTTGTREDGAKVTTVTAPDGTVTETVKQPDGTTSETVTTPEGGTTITVTDPDGEELVKAEIPAEIPAPETEFEDIDQTPWAEEAINNMAGLKLVNGIGGNKYDPTTPMTRGALATVLHRLSNGKTDYKAAFKDVLANRYYTEGVAWAAKAKVVTGYTADIFAPDDIITREQLAVMMVRYAKLIGMDTKADTKSLDTFVDGEDTGSWAVDGVAWCVEKGILKGKGLNNLDPTANVSRAEVAVMLDRFIALIQK